MVPTCEYLMETLAEWSVIRSHSLTIPLRSHRIEEGRRKMNCSQHQIWRHLQKWSSTTGKTVEVLKPKPGVVLSDNVFRCCILERSCCGNQTMNVGWHSSEMIQWSTIKSLSNHTSVKKKLSELTLGSFHLEKSGVFLYFKPEHMKQWNPGGTLSEKNNKEWMVIPGCLLIMGCF